MEEHIEVHNSNKDCLHKQWFNFTIFTTLISKFPLSLYNLESRREVKFLCKKLMWTCLCQKLPPFWWAIMYILLEAWIKHYTLYILPQCLLRTITAYEMKACSLFASKLLKHCYSMLTNLHNIKQWNERYLFPANDCCYYCTKQPFL